MSRVLLTCLVWISVVRPGLAAESLPRPIVIPGVENAFQVSGETYSGGRPEGDEAFAALRQLGVKTILSVDGTKPEVERAARFGLRYIHLPHGYDGIPTNTTLSLIKAAQTVEGPIFFHCHHGNHRAPAAVGLVCQAVAGWTTNQAVQWLKMAGTSPDFPGLYLVNTSFRPPDAEALRRTSTNFPARAQVSGLVDAMVEIDHRWDNLKAAQKADWRRPEDSLAFTPAAQSLLLLEAFRELGRNAETKARGDDFLGRLRDAEARTGELHAFLKAHPAPLNPSLAQEADGLVHSAARLCVTCHQKYRD